MSDKLNGGQRLGVAAIGVAAIGCAIGAALEIVGVSISIDWSTIAKALGLIVSSAIAAFGLAMISSAIRGRL